MPQQDREDAKLEVALDCLASSGQLRLRVLGSSMQPTIPAGSHVLIRRAGAAELKPGDVVLARTGEGVQLHRLVRIEGDRYLTRGDNHDQTDPPLEAHQLLGVAAKVERAELPGWFDRVRNKLTWR